MAYKLELTSQVQIGAALMAYQAIARRLLQELADKAPDTLDPKKLEAELVQEFKSSHSEDDNYGTEIEFVETGVGVINVFFGDIKYVPKE